MSVYGDNFDRKSDNKKLSIKQLVQTQIISSGVSHDESGKESTVALELDDLDCSNGVAVLFELNSRVNEVSLANTGSAIVHWLFALLQ
jgi:hypothetical protein